MLTARQGGVREDLPPSSASPEPHDSTFRPFRKGEGRRPVSSRASRRNPLRDSLSRSLRRLAGGPARLGTVEETETLGCQIRTRKQPQISISSNKPTPNLAKCHTSHSATLTKDCHATCALFLYFDTLHTLVPNSDFPRVAHSTGGDSKEGGESARLSWSTQPVQ